MAPRSFRQAASTINISNFSTGILDSVLNPFYKQNGGAEWFPYSVAAPGGGRRYSLRGIIDGWQWPSNYFLSAQHPNDADDPRWSDEAQGVTVAANSQWVFSTNNQDPNPEIFRRPLTAELDANYPSNKDVNETFAPIGYQESYTHMGGCDSFAGDVYVAVEYDDSEANRVFVFTVTTSSITWKGAAFVIENNGIETNASSVAINELSLFMFVSKFEGNPYQLQAYRIDYSLGVSADFPFIDNFPLFDETGGPLQMNRMQGMDVSPLGHLYLVNDEELDLSTKQGGLHGFDLTSGRRVMFFGIDYSSGGGILSRELEDVSIFDLENVPSESTVNGQIHVLGLNNDQFDSDNVTLFHISVPQNERELV